MKSDSAQTGAGIGRRVGGMLALGLLALVVACDKLRYWTFCLLQPVYAFRWRSLASILTLVVLLVTTLWLGWTGFKEYLPGDSNLDRTYRTLRLLTVNFDTNSSAADEDGSSAQVEVPFVLNVARFTGVAFAFAAFATLLGRFVLSVTETLLPMLCTRHVVLCGLGGQGGRIVRDLRGARNVIVIDPDINHEDRQQCIRDGAVVLAGRPTDSALLRRAGSHRADHVFVFYNEDRENLDTALEIKELVKETRYAWVEVLRARVAGLVDELLSTTKTTGWLVRYRKLARVRLRKVVRCHVHVSTASLSVLVEEHHTNRDSEEPFELRSYNFRERCASDMVRSNGPHVEREQGRRPAVMVIGGNTFRRAFLLRLALDLLITRRQLEPEAPATPPQPLLTVFLIDDKAGEVCAQLEKSYEIIKQVFELRPVPLTTGFDELATDEPVVDAIRGTTSDGDVDLQAIYLCFSNDVLAAEAAIAVEAIIGTSADEDRWRIPIVVRVEHTGVPRTGGRMAGIAALLSGEMQHGTTQSPRIVTVGIQDQGVHVAENVVREDVKVFLPKAIHQAYLQTRLTQFRKEWQAVRAKGSTITAKDQGPNPTRYPAVTSWFTLDRQRCAENERLARMSMDYLVHAGLETGDISFVACRLTTGAGETGEDDEFETHFAGPEQKVLLSLQAPIERLAESVMPDPIPEEHVEELCAREYASWYEFARKERDKTGETFSERECPTWDKLLQSTDKFERKGVNVPNGKDLCHSRDTTRAMIRSIPFILATVNYSVRKR